ncbi:MAG: hypothetical protein RMI56_06385 [Sulfolobales archaeon]|nr:hypothetical protein [Sulfolobales archaeon]MDW8083402.1 hypothetical protein [Sulfolobales archaeon]
MSVSRIVVRAGYRLHLGFYRYVDNGIAYGSVGIALEEPYLELHYSATSYDRKLDVRMPTEEAREAIVRVVNSVGLTSGALEMTGYVRHHVGLGSLTRIYLATAILSAVALKITDLNLEELLIKLGRCRYSCVGYYTLMYGGLAVDSGLRVSDGGIPKPLVLLRFPRSWFVVLAIPEGRGLRESEEVRYLDNPVPIEEQKELYRALVELITGAKLERIDLFTHGIETLQEVAGRYFSQAQGGFFSSPYGDLIAKTMIESGLRGIGQSSWGPAVYGFTDSFVVAEIARKAILSSLSKIGVSCDVWVSRVSEVGHTVHVSSSKF